MISSIASVFVYVMPFTVLKAGPVITFDEKAVALPKFFICICIGFPLIACSSANLEESISISAFSISCATLNVIIILIRFLRQLI